MTSHVPHTFRRSAFAVAAGLSALALAGCSGAEAAPAPSGSSDAEAGAPATIRLLQAPVFYEPIFIAMEEGLFEEQNLTIEFAESATAAEAIPQLLNGQIDIAMTGGVSLITAVTEGIPIKGILGASSADPDVCTSGLVVPADSDVKGYADLGGKTIGLQAMQETTHLGTLLAAKDAGVDTSTIEFVQLPLPNINEAVSKGTVDVGYPIGMFWGTGIEQGLVSVGCPGPEYLSYGPNVIYAATDEYIAANEDVIERFQAAIAEATEIGQKDNFARIRDVQLEKSTQDPEYIKNAIISPYYTDIYRQGVEGTANGMFEFGFITKEVGFDDLISPIAPIVD